MRREKFQDAVDAGERALGLLDDHAVALLAVGFATWAVSRHRSEPSHDDMQIFQIVVGDG